MDSANALIFEGFGKSQRLADYRAGDVIRVRTQNGHTYYILVDDPQNGHVIITSPDTEAIDGTPSRYCLQGSTRSQGDHWREVGSIHQGLCLELTPFGKEGITLVLSQVLSFDLVHEEEASKLWDLARPILQ